MFHSLLCSFGIHRFEDQPSKTEELKNTGLNWEHLLLMGVMRKNPWCIQVGIRKCTRPNCSTEVAVYRENRINLIHESVWKKFKSNTQIEYISSLPAVAD